MRKRSLVLWVGMILASGCTSFDRKDFAEHQPAMQETSGTMPLLSPLPAIENRDNPEAILTLTPEQKADFLSAYNATEIAHLPAHLRLANYIEKHYASFSYKGETFNAE